MALNWLGLGFSFGAKNKGLLRAQKQTAQGFNQMGVSAQQMNSLMTLANKGLAGMNEHLGNQKKLLSQSKMQTFLQAFSLKKMGDVADGVERVASSGRNLTTSFEATLYSNTVTAKKMAWNFGLMGKDAKKFHSQAQSLSLETGISFDQAAEATFNFQWASKALTAVGIKDFKALAKVADVTGISAGELVDQFQKIQTELGMTSESAIQNLTGAFIEAGREVGDVKLAMTSMNSSLGVLAKKAALAGKKLSDTDLAAYGKQAAQVAAAMWNVTGSTEEAMAFASSLNEKLLEGQINFQDMFAGTQPALSEIVKATGIATGDVDKAFKMMQSGPAGFMQGMGEMVDQMRTKGQDPTQLLKFMGSQLRTIFGEDEKVISLFLQKTGKGISDVMDRVGNAKNKLGDAAKDFMDPRTIAERMDLAGDILVKGFRDVSRKASEKFVSDTTKQFRTFNKEIAVIGAADGPLAAMTRQFSKMHQIGALGLVPEFLRPGAALAGKMLEELAPAIGMFHSLGLSVKDMVNPLNLAAAAAAGLGTAFFFTQQKALALDSSYQTQTKTSKKLKSQLAGMTKGTAAYDKTVAKLAETEAAMASNRKGIMQKANRTVIDGVKKTFRTVMDNVKGFIQGVQEAWPDIVAGFVSIWESPEVQGFIIGLKKWWTETAWPTIEGFFSGVVDGIMGNFDQNATGAKAMGASIGGFIGRAFDAAWELVKSVLRKWWTSFTDMWGNENLGFGEKLQKTFLFLLPGILLGLGPVITGVTTAVQLLAGPLSALGSAIIPKLLTVMTGPVGLVAGALAVGTAIGTWINSFKGVQDFVQGLYKDVGDFMDWMDEKLGRNQKSAKQKLGVGDKTIKEFGIALQRAQNGDEKSLRFIASVGEDSAMWSKALSEVGMSMGGSEEDVAKRIQEAVKKGKALGPGAMAGTPGIPAAAVKMPATPSTPARHAAPAPIQQTIYASDASMATLVEAVHMPKWYREYRELFKSQIAALTAEVTALKQGKGKGSPSPANGLGSMIHRPGQS